jgi:hypothetical protein
LDLDYEVAVQNAQMYRQEENSVLRKLDGGDVADCFLQSIQRCVKSGSTEESTESLTMLRARLHRYGTVSVAAKKMLENISGGNRPSCCVCGKSVRDHI